MEKLLSAAVLLATVVDLCAAPPEPIQQPAPTLGLGATIDQEFEKLTNFGVSPFLAYYGAYQGNPVGGLQEDRTAYSHLILFGTTLDFDKLMGLPGGSLYISGAEVEGKNLSTYIGNINSVSEAFVTPDTLMFYELYWKQILFDDKVDLRLGRMTAADQFASVPAFELQVSGGINGNPTSLFVNAPFTSSPVATWAASANFHVTKQFYAEAGVYQASERFGKLDDHGLNFTIHSDDGELVMWQIGWEPTFSESPVRTSFDKNGNKSLEESNSGFPGHYILGGYYSNFDFPELNGPNIQHSAYGFYAMGQQMVWRSASNPFTNFTVWGGLTFSPQQNIALLPLMGFAGIIWQGFVPGRDRDQFLLTYLVSSFSHADPESVDALGKYRATAEHVLEASYAVWVTKTYSVQPDAQYVIRPNGDAHVRNALVVGIQLVADF
jgi:porin